MITEVAPDAIGIGIPGDRMKKIIVLVVALIVFLVVLAVAIVPQQGGNISSTSIEAQGISNANPAYNETLPIQDADLGSSGRSVLIALVMLTHMLFANLQLGGAWVAAGTETAYLKTKKESSKRLARSISLFNVILFSTGATFAVAGVLFFISLYPVFATEVFHIYWWPLLIEAFAFALEILFLYSYWFSWDKISQRSHQVLGYAFAVTVFVQTLMINTLASGMLTPGASTIQWGQAGLLTMPPADLMAWWSNGTTWILQFHRLAGSVSYFGFVLAMLGMFHYLDRKDAASKTYWDRVASYGLTWGLLGLIFQPVLGLAYMSLIKANQIGSFSMIMLGNRAWEMVLMVGLLSFLFIALLVYLYDRKERILLQAQNKRLHNLFKIFIVIAAICGIILVQPATMSFGINPLGYMSYKLVALFILICIGATVLGIDVIMLKDPVKVEWGNLSATSRSAALIAGVLGMWILIVMGFVRESSREPWLVNGIIPVPGGQAYPTPIPVTGIFAVWFIITAGTIVIFWFVSKVTAEHPEMAEEV
jgi:cytochrome bd-type quinol oxidase subunit 1